MEFGAWIKQLRMEQQLSGKDLAARSGVNAGTISRVELGRTDTTMSTVVRLCRALGVGFSEFYEAMRKNAAKSLATQPVDSVAYYNVLQRKDVVNFIRFFRKDPSACVQFTAEFINAVADLQPKRRTARKGTKITSLQLQPIDLDNLSKDLPLHVLRVPYPPDISSDILDVTVNIDGVIIPEDFRVFLKKLRQEKKLTLEELAEALGDGGPSASTLSRLESGATEQLTLLQVFILSDYLGSAYSLVKMCWEIGILQAERAIYTLLPDISNAPIMPPQDWSLEEIELAYIFVKTGRWLQYLRIRKFWLSAIREALQTYEA